MHSGELAAASLTVGANALVHRVLPESTHVPANLLTAAAAVGIARMGGASWDDMGLDPAYLGRGLRYGAVAAAATVGAVAVVASVPALRHQFLDERVVGASRRRAAYELGLRIPVGTALSEEMLFRGALPAIFGRDRGPAASTVLSNAAFGLWHVLPTTSSLDTHPSGVHARANHGRSIAAVVGVVAVTAAAGFAFSELRRRSHSVLAPVIAHGALNAATYAAARALSRR